MDISTSNSDKQRAIPVPPKDNKGIRILAKSIFRELTSQGYDERQIVALATELISEVTTRLNTEA